MPPVAITTSTTATATAYSNQRKIDRCQNGVLWAMWDTGSVTEFWYSTDEGATWAKDPANRERYPGSIFIDLDDYCHYVYRNGVDGFIMYRRGTPNAGRTAWTWSGATVVENTTSDADLPDVVAHREGTGWRAHVIYSYKWSGGSQNNTFYKPVTITSGGAISAGTRNLIGGDYSGNLHTYPSIDFNHTGDGKTVAGGTPHLYAAWSAGSTGSGRGIRFKKATYSGGSWTWGTEREIDSGRYVDTAAKWIACLFDGTGVVIGGWIRDAGSTNNQVLYERNAADTSGSTLLAQAFGMTHGSVSYDQDRNVYFLGHSGGTDLRLRKWTRATLSEGPVGAGTITTSGSVPHISAKRGFSGGRIEFVYTDGASSPYTVTYDSILLPTGGPRMMV